MLRIIIYHFNEFIADLKKKRFPKKSLFQGERRGSNPRQPEPQSGTLPAELRPP